jgi:hypothetical protein
MHFQIKNKNGITGFLRKQSNVTKKIQIEKRLKFFDICNNSAAGNSCKYENNQIYNGTGIYDKWYLCRMEIIVPVGGTTLKNGIRIQRKKKRILYFQIH